MREASDQVVLSGGSTDNISVDCEPYLDGDLVSAVATPVEIDTNEDAVVSGDLTLSGEIVGSSEKFIQGRKVIAGKWVRFTITGHEANSTYWVKVQITTDAGRIEPFKIKVIAK